MRGTIFGEGGEVEYFKLSGENNLLRPINEEYKIGVQSARVSTWGGDAYRPPQVPISLWGIEDQINYNALSSSVSVCLWTRMR